MGAQASSPLKTYGIMMYSKSNSTMEASLDAIGLKHGTDKASNDHDYLRHYQHHLTAAKSAGIDCIMEIGIFNGASLRMWKEWSQAKKVVGLDINKDTKKHEEGNIVVEIGNQEDPQFLVSCVVSHNPSIVIEDGSHLWDHQIIAFQTIFPLLERGSTYIMEDLHVGFGDLAAKFSNGFATSGFEYLSKILRFHTSGGFATKCIDDPFVNYAARAIDSMCFIKKSCIITKK